MNNANSPTVSDALSSPRDALVATYGCGLSDRVVAAAHVVGDEKILGINVGAVEIDCVGPSPVAGVNRFAPAAEGRARVVVPTARGFVVEYVRVEFCSDHRWHACGRSF